MLRFKTPLVAALLTLTPVAVQAQDVMNIFVGDLGLTFQNGDLGDSQNPTNGVSGLPELSTVVSTAEVTVNGERQALVTAPSDSVFVDLANFALPSELAVGELASGGPGALDLFSTTTGLFLQLDLITFDYLLVDSDVPGADLFFFTAESQLFIPENQVIPGGFTFDDTVLVSYTSTDADFTFGPDGGVSAFTASGQLTITGTAVPEPSSLALIALGGAAMLRRRRRA